MSCRERGSGSKRGSGYGRELWMPGRRLSRARPSTAGRLVRTGISDRDGNHGEDRPCHDADTPGGQSCAAGMAGAADGGPRRAAALRCGKADAGESGEHARPREFSRQAAPSPAGTDTTGSRTLPARRQGLATPGTGRAGRLSRGRPRPSAPRSRAPWPASADTPATSSRCPAPAASCWDENPPCSPCAAPTSCRRLHYFGRNPGFLARLFCR